MHHQLLNLNITPHRAEIVLRLSDGSVLKAHSGSSPEEISRSVRQVLSSEKEAPNIGEIRIRFDAPLTISHLTQKLLVITDEAFTGLVERIPVFEGGEPLSQIANKVIGLSAKDPISQLKKILERMKSDEPLCIAMSFQRSSELVRFEGELRELCDSLGVKDIFFCHPNNSTFGFIQRTRRTVLDAVCGASVQDFLNAIQQSFRSAPILVLGESGGLHSSDDIIHPSSLFQAESHAATLHVLSAYQMKSGAVLELKGYETVISEISHFEKRFPDRCFRSSNTLGKNYFSGRVSVPVGMQSLVGLQNGRIVFSPVDTVSEESSVSLFDILSARFSLLQGIPLDRGKLQGLTSLLDEFHSWGEPLLPVEEFIELVAELWFLEVRTGLRTYRSLNSVDSSTPLLVVGEGSQYLLTHSALHSELKNYRTHLFFDVWNAYLLQFAPKHEVIECSSRVEMSELPRFSQESDSYNSIQRIEFMKYDIPECSSKVVPVLWSGEKSSHEIFEREHLRRYHSVFPGEKITSLGSVYIAESKALFEEAPLLKGDARVPLSEVEASGGEIALHDLSPQTLVKGPGTLLYDSGRWWIPPRFEVVVLSAALLHIRDRMPDQETTHPLANASPLAAGGKDFLFRQRTFLLSQVERGLQLPSLDRSSTEWGDTFVALCDLKGEVIGASKWHPLHLSSVSMVVAEFIASRGTKIKDGEYYAENEPYSHGTHLNDVTVLSQYSVSGKRAGYIVTRSHFRDVGGLVPGANAPDAASIEQEGVRFEALRLTDDDARTERDVLEVFRKGDFSAKHPRKAVTEFRAHITCHKQLRELLGEVFSEVPSELMSAAEESLRKYVCTVIERKLTPRLKFPKHGKYHGRYPISTNLSFEAEIARKGESLAFSFQGCDEQRAGCFNTSLSVTHGAVLAGCYELAEKTLISHGALLKRIQCSVPERTVLNARSSVGVGEGPSFTFAQLESGLLHLFHHQGASYQVGGILVFQFGERVETEVFPGGIGATKKQDGKSFGRFLGEGPSFSDPEHLEALFPVKLERFERRKNSGGKGKECGSDGALIHLRFLEECVVGILSPSREHVPLGLEEGYPGMVGWTYIERASSEVSTIGTNVRTRVRAGDLLVFETPGGGGVGRKGK